MRLTSLVCTLCNAGQSTLINSNIIQMEFNESHILNSNQTQSINKYNSRNSFYSVGVQVVTLWYRAPEVLLNQPYNSAVDIWSSACIIYEIFSRRALFPGTSERNQLEKIFTWVLFFTAAAKTNVKMLLLYLLTNRLIGTPRPNQWPTDIPISREHFTLRSPKRPIDFCHELDEYANELLRVC